MGKKKEAARLGAGNLAQDDGSGYRPRVVVKFHDFVDLPYEDKVEGEIEARKIGPWSQLARDFPGVTCRRLYTALAPEEIRAVVARATERDRAYRPPNMMAYFLVECPPGSDPEALAKALTSWRTVQAAYVEGGPTPPPLVNPGDDPRFPNQGYLDPAPDGIDAEYAWTFAGGDGAGLRFIDMEQGWTLNHEDLNAAGITLISGLNQAYFYHGTSVLGELAAVDNTIGDVGVVPHATGSVVSQWRTAANYNTADAILTAVSNLGFGDVLLLEAQTTVAGSSFLPVEVELAVFDAIRLGTALGIVIVEAAGNGSNDLDTFTDGGGHQVLNRGSADFQDSGAIMVGAASSAAPHMRLGFSNYGSRIDCYAWGENIDTCTSDNMHSTTLYTVGFGGTSGASPIVTGAALAVQGMAQASLGYRYSPARLRAILSDPATGTSSGNPAVDRIGVMPNLRHIIDDVLGVSADSYLRDFVGDTGDPHSGAISASPDIILRTALVADPQAAFGQGSGTENSNTLGDEAEAGQDNYIYIRVLNRGGASATNVTATVYWSPPATLVTPDLWTLAGSVGIPNVPSGDVLTVSDAITWPSAAIPAPGHYCFVGLVGNPSDPAPAPADFMNFDNFRLFIRNNNNVTWRNFNVVNNVPPPNAEPPGYVALPFLFPGAPDRARRMQLETVMRLPEGALALLEAPKYLLDAMQEPSPFWTEDKRSGMVRVSINPHGRQPFGEVLLPAKSRAACRLLVQIPKEWRKGAYEVYARQLYDGEEVGRVTWRLTARARDGRPQQSPLAGRD
jgi:hypothetical protein